MFSFYRVNRGPLGKLAAAHSTVSWAAKVTASSDTDGHVNGRYLPVLCLWVKGFCLVREKGYGKTHRLRYRSSVLCVFLRAVVLLATRQVKGVLGPLFDFACLARAADALLQLSVGGMFASKPREC